MPVFQRLKNLIRNELTPGACRETSAPTLILQDSGDWRDLLERSNERPVVVFKHSTSCGISHEVLKEFQEFVSRNEPIAYGIVNVIEDRRLSDTIAAEMGIRHASPQAIVIQNEQPVWHASHWSIMGDELEKAVLR